MIYYGDEIGMGDNIYLGDRDGVRTPMQWSADRNAGFSRADPQQLYLPPIRDAVYGYEGGQRGGAGAHPHVAPRLDQTPDQGCGRITASSDAARSPLSTRRIATSSPFCANTRGRTILCAYNLSRFCQPAELDLSGYIGSQPVELFGRIPFPKIGELPYLITFGPHGFYWFELRAVEE